jgi:predicted AlkP superfamily pyrophosphatase or phosphodiesterase
MVSMRSAQMRMVPANDSRPVGRLARWGAGLVTLCILSSLLGCAASGPLTTPLRPTVLRPHPGVVLFLCDGLGADVLEQGCREGLLPNLDRRFLQRGIRVEHAITVFPAITYAAIATQLTGVSPEQHGVLGNRWFDPDLRLFRNYTTLTRYREVNGDFSVPTIYERIRPRRSANIQTALMRGASEDIPNWAQSGVRWFFGEFSGVDTLTATTVNLVAQRANQRGRWPDMLTCYFPGLDTVGHRHGVSSPQYLAAIQNLDQQVRRICDWLEAQGLLDTTYLILISDHGMVDVAPSGHIDLARLVREQWGWKATTTMDQDNPYDERRRYFDHFNCVVAYQDGRKAFLYFAGPAGWDQRPTPEAVVQILSTPPPEQQLWNVPGIDLVAYLVSDTEALLRSARGDAHILERQTPDGPEYCYVPEPADPLSYRDDPKLATFVAAGYHGSRSWLEATCDHEFPDLVPHVIPLLRHPRGGQVIVCTAPGYSFRNELGGHGGVRRQEMRVPMIFVGPGLEPGGTIRCARAVDLTPTILALMQVEPPDDDILEGVPLLAPDSYTGRPGGR